MESKLRTPPLSKQSSIAAPTPKSALSPSSGTADNTRSIDIRQFPKLQYSDDLQTTLSNSELLLKKVYRLRLGINSKYHPTTADIDKKYGEVTSRLVKAFPENPTNLPMEKMDNVVVVQAAAGRIVEELRPTVAVYDEVNHFLNTTEKLLANIQQSAGPFTFSNAPLLLTAYMGLVCNAFRIMYLLSMPECKCKLVMQLYALAFHHLHKAHMPRHSPLADLISSCDNPAEGLQRRFESLTMRIIQVLELVVAPVLVKMSDVANINQSALFEPFHAADNKYGICGMSVERSYEELTHVDDLRQWGIIGLLLCKGALRSPTCRALLDVLLRETLLLQVYREISTNVHDLAGMALGRTLKEQYEDQRKQVRDKDQLAALRKRTELAIDEARQEAQAGCAAQHRLRRCWAADKLQAIHAWLRTNLSWLPVQLPMVLALVSYARSEALWLFQHLSHGAAGSDLEAAMLLAAIEDMRALLLSHSGAMRTHLALQLRNTLDNYLRPQFVEVDELFEHDSVSQEGTAAVLDLCEQTADKLQLLLASCVAEDYLDSAADAQEAAATASVEQAGAKAAQAAAAALSAEDAAVDSDQPFSPSSAASTASKTAPKAAAADAAVGGAGGEAGMQLVAAGPAASVLASEPSSPRQLQAAVALLPVEAEQLSKELSELHRSWVDLMKVLLRLPLQGMDDGPRIKPIRDAGINTLARCPRFLATFQKAIQQAEALVDYRAFVHRHCSLQQLIFYQQALRSSLASALHEAGPRGPVLLAAVPRAMRLLRTFELNNDRWCTSKDHAVTAADLGQALLDEACTSFKGMLRQLVAATGTAGKRLTSEAYNRPAPAPRTKTLATRVEVPAAPPPVPVWTPPLAQVMARAAALAAALDDLGPLQVTSRLALVPREALREVFGLQLDTMLRSLAGRVASRDDSKNVPDVLPPLSVLAAEVRDFLSVASSLQASMSFDIMPTLHQVLVKHCQPAKGLARSRAEAAARLAGASDVGMKPSGQALVPAIADWLYWRLIKDSQQAGVMFSPQLRCFVTGGKVDKVEAGRGDSAPRRSQPSDLQQWSSVEELKALIQVFGPYAASTIAERLLGCIRDCLDTLDKLLDKHQPDLEQVMDQYEAKGSCLEAASAAAEKLCGEVAASTLHCVKLLSRCLALRSLLGEACAGALSQAAPWLVAAVETMVTTSAMGTAEGPGRHVCDVLELPRPGRGFDCTPTAADPLLISYLIGNDKVDKYHRWNQLPVLLAMTIGNVSLAAAGYSPVTRTFSNEVHALGICLKAMAVAQEEASNRMLAYGSKFLHPDTTSAADDIIACFCHVAATTMYLKHETMGQASTKQLLLDTLASSCSNIHKPGNISALWTPASRVWAAMQACTSGGSALQNSYLGTGLAGGAAARGSTTAGTRTMTTMVV